MGGPTSTRWNGIKTRSTTDECLRVTLDRGLRTAVKTVQTHLADGKASSGAVVLEWSSRGHTRGSIWVRICGELGVGVFAQLVYNANEEPVEERVRIAYTPQKLGGQRAWWVCPGCQRRCSVLYCPNRQGASRFRCRTCQNVCYTSQCESDKQVYALARNMAAGERFKGASRMPCHIIIRSIRAHEVAQRRLVRRLRREEGKRWARKNKWYLDMLGAM